MEEIRKIVRGILSEIMDRTDSYTPFLAAKKYAKLPNLYIHFTDVYKLGINPRKTHADPHAIYFYPAKWILDEENWSGFQYAVNMKYFFLCQVDTSNFLNLSKLTMPEADRLMENAGISDIWQMYGKNFGTNPGKRFWNFLDMLNVEPSKRDNPKHHQLPYIKWNQFWSTTEYDGFSDTKGIVNEGEKQQIGVLNPRTIKIIESGENKNVKSISMQFYEEIIKKNNINVSYQGYQENGKYYRIYGTSGGRAADIRIYPDDFMGIAYYNDDKGNIYKLQTEMTFDSYRARPSILSMVEKAFEESGSSEVSYEKVDTLKSIANAVFKDVKESGFMSPGGIFNKSPMIYRKDDKNFRDVYFWGGISFDEKGRPILNFKFSVDKSLLLNPNVEEEPVFEVNMFVNSPEAAYKKVISDFEKWIKSYQWKPANPKAKLAYHRIPVENKIRDWFYEYIKKP